MGCRIDGQTGTQREGEEARKEGREGEGVRGRREGESEGNKVPLFFVASQSGHRGGEKRARASERGCCWEDNGEMSCRINFVGL